MKRGGFMPTSRSSASQNSASPLRSSSRPKKVSPVTRCGTLVSTRSFQAVHNSGDRTYCCTYVARGRRQPLACNQPSRYWLGLTTASARATDSRSMKSITGSSTVSR